jgi:hypothetical protein
MNEQLAKSRFGRVILHAVCLLRNPHRAHWHWRGIVREFHPATQLNRLRAK